MERPQVRGLDSCLSRSQARPKSAVVHQIPTANKPPLCEISDGFWRVTIQKVSPAAEIVKEIIGEAQAVMLGLTQLRIG
jgi:hypothetical protein